MPATLLALLKWFETPTGQRVLFWLGRPIIKKLQSLIASLYQKLKDKLKTSQYKKAIENQDRDQKEKDLEKFLNS